MNTGAVNNVKPCDGSESPHLSGNTADKGTLINEPGRTKCTAGFFIHMKSPAGNYEKCLEELYSLGRFGIILGLSTIKKVLKRLGSPQNQFLSIHIAGSNGKGSIASALASILVASGQKVGLYTSPHLVRFNERICVNREPISDKAVMDAYLSVKRVTSGGREPTFFEYATAMAFYEFARQKVDWAVIETGMGGRLDATNIINPVLSIISNISLEHQKYLGKTLALIAAEKGGIIKRETPVVTGTKQPAAVSVLNKIATFKQAPLYRLGGDFKTRRDKIGGFTYFGIQNTWKNMSNGLLGNHQVSNAALTLAACEVLDNKKTDISVENIKDVFLKNSWQGRLEVVSRSPLVIFDGAHNLMASRNLARFLSNSFKDKAVTLVIGILDDKPYKAMLKSLLPFCNRVIVTQAKTGRALPLKILVREAKEIHSNVTSIPDVADALTHAVKTLPQNNAVCVAGSLYVVGEAKAFIEKNPSVIGKK